MRSRIFGGNSINVGIYNRNLVFEVIRSRGPISRAEIARATNLTTAAITNIVRALVADGFVEEIGPGESSGGRKPGLLQVRKGSRYSLAADLAGTNLSVALTTITGEIVARVEKNMPADSGQAVDALIEAIGELRKANGVDPAKIVGIGVTTPGLIDRATGTVIKSVRLGWYGVPLKAILENALDFPVFIGKDTESAILGEQWYGIGRGVDNLIYVWVGTGIAIGILLNGQVYTGSTGMAGEFGHTSIQADGTRCRCGNEGCLEGLAGLEAISERAKGALMQGARSSIPGMTLDPNIGSPARIAPMSVLDAAAAGDPVAIEIVEDAGRKLGIGVANLINIFNPQVILIGGQIRPKDERFIAEVKRVAKQRALAEIASAVTIDVSHLGRDAGLMGGTALVWRNLFGTA
ncbi:MAG TPA: ROK family transcriptional regulator [Firmicutes bacterium]|nr:ROK family transcriptional regulator [Bacillota bacterium]HHY98597.1 ROK family transcriptional regulator [Bacillota bacterium]